ncbi:GntR family transcriptional regulator [Lampropedia aestuarii]|uniref:GntR family transcriptional regulator n=1 Tax=Lampropedia aestuarii TaxID=2562762 RepID=A0A4S5BI59_9BURK|nr:GntR family transcriptional regulator [Lampropedia aestuarii]THJ30465.1 GntR family transcriptional regulator [Lampropedia aestuarii]
MTTTQTPNDDAPSSPADSLRDAMAIERAHPTLRQLALEKLRQAIIGGQLPPGARLVERTLCDLLGVSRSVVRESLGQLEAEGWITKEPYKGPTVAVIDEDGVRQIFEMRAAIEGRVAALSAHRATAEQIDALEVTLVAMTKAQAAADVEAQIEAIESFYEVLLEAAGNELMASYLAAQRNRLARLRRLSLSHSPRASASVEEKRQIVAAIRHKDAKTASELAEQHVWNSSESLLAVVRKDAADSDKRSR